MSRPKWSADGRSVLVLLEESRTTWLSRIDLAGARRYLLSEVPSGSLPALLATGTALAFQRLVLPAVHWLVCARPTAFSP